MDMSREEKRTELFDMALRGICQSLRQIIQKVPQNIKLSAQEIRLRVNSPVIIFCSSQAHFVTKNGETVQNINENILNAGQNEIIQSFHNICNYSVYSHQNEIKNGFITMRGGHRVGICGTAVLNNSAMTGIRDISSLNIRIAREVKGSANDLLKMLLNTKTVSSASNDKNFGYEKPEPVNRLVKYEGVSIKESVSGLLIAGAPSCGKTTILRDIARQLSLKFIKVAVVDERGELGAVNSGVCQNDMGFCDVLNGYSKGEGILQAIRCLSPDIIICDELGSNEEINAIEEGLNAGVGIIASVHASDMEELKRRPQVRKLISTGAFQNVALLSSRDNPGNIKGIYRIGDTNA